MKRISSLVLCILLLTVFAVGCGGKDRELYAKTDLSKYVELGEYKGIKVDTTTDEFKEFLDSVIKSDIENNELYVKKTEGAVADGDTANIDYVGKKDGVAFEGGTAQGYDLKIGSNSFIDGFEDGLIGVNIGDTVDLNLTFPKNYQSKELAGAAVVFTVKVNYVTTTEPLDAKDYYSELGFKSLEKYNADVKKRAVKNYLYNEVVENSKVKDYPESEQKKLLTAVTEYFDNMYQQYYGADLETVLSSSGMTMEDFEKEMISNTISPMMEAQMVLYSIVDNEKIEIDAETVKNQVVTNATLKEGSAVEEIVTEWLYNNAVIK